MAVQYRIELALAGLEDGPPGGMSTSERLEALRAHQRAWQELKASAILVQDETSDMHVAVFPGAAMWAHTENGSPRSLWLHQIPSLIRGIPSRTWTLDDVGFDVDVDRLCLDPAQDLLVAIEQAHEG